MGAEALEALARASRSPDIEVRYRAIRAAKAIRARMQRVAREGARTHGTSDRVQPPESIATWAQRLLDKDTARRLAVAMLQRSKAVPPPERIPALIKTLHSGTYESSYLAMSDLARIGAACVPYLVGDLANDDADRRIKATCTPSRMGEGHVPAIAEHLRASDERIREGICVVLGYIGGDDAIAHLQKVAARTDEEPHVRHAGNAALATLSSR